MSEIRYGFKIGDFQVYTFSDGRVFGQADRFFVGPTDEERAIALEKAGIEADKVPSWFTPVLIDTGQQKILLDTGIGENAENPEFGNLMGNLAAAGLSVEDIDVVFISHHHADHTGCNTTEDGMPRFPNARYLIGCTEWEHHTSKAALAEVNFHTPHVRKQLMGIQDRIEFVDAGTKIVEGLQVIDCAGHTFGQLGIHVESKGEHFIYAADAMLNPLHLEYLGWNYHSDADFDIAVATRHRIAELAIETNALVTAYHFPFPAVGRIRRVGEGYLWKVGVE